MARAMKDSGIECIGEIPKNWSIGKVKKYYKMQTGFTPNTKQEEYYDNINGKSWVTISDLDGCKYVTNDTKSKISELYINKFKPQIIPSGSLLYSFKLSVGQVAINSMETYTNEAIASFINSNDISLDYLFYSSMLIIENANENIYGAKILNQNLIKNAYIIWPPLTEQRLIASFLDSKCQEIDNVLAKTRSSIEEYKKLKQAIITKAVTKGVKSDVKTKDSGIEWIGKIPVHWETIRLKYCSYMKGRIGWQGLKYEDFIEEGPYCVTGTDFINGKINWDTCYHVSEERYDMDSNIQLQLGDLLVTKDGTIGKLAVVDYLPDRACLNSHLLIVRPLLKQYDSKFLYYVMSSNVFRKYYNTFSSGSIMDSISQEKMSNFCIPLPDIGEQKLIINYLDAKCTEIDNITSKKEQLVSELESYKKSLIYEYVTGKKEVPTT